MLKRKQPELTEVDWALADKSPLQFLIQPESLSTFLSEVWEKGPKLYKALPGRQQLFPDLCSLAFLQTLLGEEQLEFGVDLNAARYINGERETPNGEEADAETVMGLYNEGCTLQLHQPQRWNASLWRLIAAMETQLGCLVGANAYLTPSGTQGLAPHYDDVDLWVCQTEGTKHWRVYNIPEGYALPAVPSRDFAQDAIGAPLLDVTLEVGDVLFMPRGTVHQAVAQEAASCHVTISTYQKWALADFAVALLQELQQGQPATRGCGATLCLPPPLRRGLSLGFLSSAGLQVDKMAAPKGDQAPPVAKQAAQALRVLADRLESDPALTSVAADRMALDFITSRAPPFPDQLLDRGGVPTISSRVRSVGPSYFRLLPCQASREVQEAYDGETSFVRVLSCLKNSITHHMMGAGCGHVHDEDEEEEANAEQAPATERAAKTKAKAVVAEEENLGSNSKGDDDEDDDEEDEEEEGGELVFPASYSTALAQLLQAETPISVRDLRLRSKEEKVGLTYSLWAEGMVCTDVPETASKSKKQKK